MNLREVTVGRSKNCDIYLDQQCQFASNVHGKIYTDGDQLMFKDVSTNGTLINNVNIHKRSVPIHRGDIIMIAGKYPLNWNQIDHFFPPVPHRPVQSGTIIEQEIILPPRQPDLTKWNWGAFFLNFIWGPFNGCWWTLVVWVVCTVLSFVPVINLISGLAYLIFSIVLGAKGTQWAWENKVWSGADDFEQTQSTWAKVGIAIFVVSFVLCVLLIILGLLLV